MEPILQPQRTTQILDRTVHVFRRHFLTFVLLCLPAVVFVAGSGELGRRAFSVIYKDRSVQIFLGWIFEIVAYATAFGATAAPVVIGLRAIESSQPISAIGCYRGTRGHYLRIAGIESLLGLRLIGVFLLGSVVQLLGLAVAIRFSPFMFSHLVAVRIIMGLAVLLLIVGSMFWMIHSFAKHCLACACCVVENTGVRASLKRSRRLTKGALRRVWTMFFFALCLFIPIASLAELPAALAEGWVGHNKGLYESWTVFASIVGMAISAPIVVIGTVLIYYDQRVRREAFDVERLISAAEAANVAEATEPTPSAELPSVNVSVANAETASVEKADEPPETMGAASGS
jgi:hypothetical protein